MNTFSILFFGDVVGSLGRTALATILPALKARFEPDLVIANAENLAHGAGVTEKTLRTLMDAGVDVFTGGNHSWGNPLGLPLFEDPEWKTRLVVPINYGNSKNGQNALLVEKEHGSVVVFNIMGQLFTHPDTRSPFQTLDELLEKHTSEKPLITLVDFHAEATAEKEAFGHYADGKVTAVLGTHTHVASADAKLLPKSTLYITDVGRCGLHQSVIGFDPESALKRFLNPEAGRTYMLPDHGQAEVNGVFIQASTETGHVTSFERIREILDI